MPLLTIAKYYFMLKDLSVEKSIDIHASPAHVWKSLTTPDLIRQYLFGTKTLTDWKEGSAIRFVGTYEGTPYEDKGVLKKVEPEKCLEYTYYSSFSGLEDLSENYSLVTFTIEERDGDAILHLRQRYFASEEKQEHAKASWGMVLSEIKHLTEG